MEAYYVSVNFKMNRFSLGVPSRGIEASQLRQLACAKFDVNASRYYLLERGQRVKDKTTLSPFTVVDLVSYDDNGDQESAPKLQTILYDSTTTHWARQRTDLFLMAARDLYLSLTQYLMLHARYRQWEATVTFPDTSQHPQGPHHVLPTWLDPICKAICNPDEQNMILVQLEGLCIADGLSPRINDRTWTFNWKRRALDAKMPRITARDLISMGYNPANGDLFARILNKLRQAIEANEVSGESELAQREWVRKTFMK